MNNFAKSLVALAAALVITGAAQAAPTFVTLTADLDGANNATQIAQGRIDSTTYRWTRNNVYILTKVIFVNSGIRLIIEPGTVVRGVPRGAAGSDILLEPGTLVASRGGQIHANGTPDDPIIFTSIDDPYVIGGTATIPASYVNSTGTTKFVTPVDHSPTGVTGTNGFAYAGRWGGVLLLGHAYASAYTSGSVPASALVDNNSDGLPDEVHTLTDPSPASQTNAGTGRDIIEGFDSSGINKGSQAWYGNKNDNDNSGTLRFASIRYSGFILGASNEVNSLTMGSIGNNTVLENVEVANGLDDGFEWFGGKCDTRFLTAYNIFDDAFDGDEGFRTVSQFWAAIQSVATTNRSNFAPNNTQVGFAFSDASFNELFEVDGNEPNNSSTYPVTTMNVYNTTLLAEGLATDNRIRFRLQSRGYLYNTALGNSSRLFANAVSGTVPTVEDGNQAFGTIVDVFNWHYYFDGNVGTNERREAVDLVAPTLTSATEETVPQFVSSAALTRNGLDLRLTGSASARVNDGPIPSATFGPSSDPLVKVNYAGWFRDNLWLKGWTLASALDVLPTTNLSRPAVTLGVSGSNPTFTFASSGTGVSYVVERSTDRRRYTPILSGTTFSGASTITGTDTGAVVSGTAPLYYRAYGL